MNRYEPVAASRGLPTGLRCGTPYEVEDRRPSDERTGPGRAADRERPAGVLGQNTRQSGRIPLVQGGGVARQRLLHGKPVHNVFPGQPRGATVGRRHVVPPFVGWDVRNRRR